MKNSKQSSVNSRQSTVDKKEILNHVATLPEQIVYVEACIRMMEKDKEAPQEVINMDKQILDSLKSLREIVTRMADKL